jgi:hypothetical protein
MQGSQYFYINTQDCWVKLPSNLWFQKFQLEACINNSFQFNTKFYLFAETEAKLVPLTHIYLTAIHTIHSKF